MGEPAEWRVEKAVASILENLNDRRGYRQLWEEIDEETQTEIRRSLEKEVREAFSTKWAWEHDE